MTGRTVGETLADWWLAVDDAARALARRLVEAFRAGVAKAGRALSGRPAPRDVAHSLAVGVHYSSAEAPRWLRAVDEAGAHSDAPSSPLVDRVRAQAATRWVPFLDLDTGKHYARGPHGERVTVRPGPDGRISAADVARGLGTASFNLAAGDVTFRNCWLVRSDDDVVVRDIAATSPRPYVGPDEGPAASTTGDVQGALAEAGWPIGEPLDGADMHAFESLPKH